MNAKRLTVAFITVPASSAGSTSAIEPPKVPIAERTASKTAPAIVKKLSDKLTRLAATQQFKDSCLAQGLEADIQDVATYKAAAPAELEKWRRFVELAKGKVK